VARCRRLRLYSCCRAILADFVATSPAPPPSNAQREPATAAAITETPAPSRWRENLGDRAVRLVAVSWAHVSFVSEDLAVSGGTRVTHDKRRHAPSSSGDGSAIASGPAARHVCDPRRPPRTYARLQLLGKAALSFSDMPSSARGLMASRASAVPRSSARGPSAASAVRHQHRVVQCWARGWSTARPARLTRLDFGDSKVLRPLL